MLPEFQDSPSLGLQYCGIPYVPVHVCLNLRSPVFDSGFRGFEAFWASVPEASVDEDDDSFSDKSEVSADFVDSVVESVSSDSFIIYGPS